MTSVHPDIANIANLLREAGLVPPVGGDVQEVRDFLERINRLTGRDSVPLTRERRLEFPVNGRQVPCKLYLPDDADAPHLMFYCHGGGFRHGALAGWDAPLRQLVRESGVAVLSIEYALSPEYTFPVAYEEIVSILAAVIDTGSVDGHAINGFALGGDSAGANLALAAAIALRNSGINALRYLMLFYGVYSRDVTSNSWRRLSGYGGHGLSSKSMSTYWQSYLANDETDWRVQPLHADLAGLPPTRLIVGDLDPLLDENIALEKTLEASGVSARLTILPNIIHGVVRFNEVAPVVRDLLSTEASALREALN